MSENQIKYFAENGELLLILISNQQAEGDCEFHFGMAES
jgi:hypothetical protein